jgi:O-antigen/teichoic acid export membrane protein
MNLKRIARNVVSNWAGMAVTLLAGLVLLPFLVRRLGQTDYGLWILISSFTGYFGLLDLGIRSSVGREIAVQRAKGSQDGVNAIVSTALAFLSAAGLVALLASAGFALVVEHVFREVPPEAVPDCRLALVLIGLNLALWLPLSVFDSMLWARQHFGLLNATEIGTTLVRTGLTFYCVANGGGLVALAVINLVSLAGAQGARGALVLGLDRRGLCVGPSRITREAARCLFGFGVWNFLMQVARLINGQLGTFLIGALMNVALVTPFSIAARLIGYAREFLAASTAVLTPVAVTLHAEEDEARQRRLFLEGGKYCLVLTTFIVTVLLVLGQSVLALWVGPRLASASDLVVLLTLGEALPMAQWVSFSVILGKGGHRRLAFYSLAENLAALPLALLLAGPWGLAGVCVAFAVPAALFRGLLQLLYACGLVGVSPGEYVRRALVPVLAVAAGPALGLVVLAWWRPVDGWAALVGYTAGYGVAHLLACGLLVGYGRLPVGRIVAPVTSRTPRWARLRARLVTEPPAPLPPDPPRREYAHERSPRPVPDAQEG